MEATIKVINSIRGMYAAEIDGSGEYVIFQLLDSYEPEIGDIITHEDFYSMGGETYKKLTQDCEFVVAVENVCSSKFS